MMRVRKINKYEREISFEPEVDKKKSIGQIYVEEYNMYLLENGRNTNLPSHH